MADGVAAGGAGVAAGSAGAPPQPKTTREENANAIETSFDMGSKAIIGSSGRQERSDDARGGRSSASSVCWLRVGNPGREHGGLATSVAKLSADRFAPTPGVRIRVDGTSVAVPGRYRLPPALRSDGSGYELLRSVSGSELGALVGAPAPQAPVGLERTGVLEPRAHARPRSAGDLHRLRAHSDRAVAYLSLAVVAPAEERLAASQTAGVRSARSRLSPIGRRTSRGRLASNAHRAVSCRALQVAPPTPESAIAPQGASVRVPERYRLELRGHVHPHRRRVILAGVAVDERGGVLPPAPHGSIGTHAAGGARSRSDIRPSPRRNRLRAIAQRNARAVTDLAGIVRPPTRRRLIRADAARVRGPQGQRAPSSRVPPHPRRCVAELLAANP